MTQTPSFESELKAIRKKHEDLGKPLPAEKIDLQQENVYYSAWYYCAVHMLLTIPSVQTETAISERLHLLSTQVRKILKTLESLNLVKKNQNIWESTENNSHLNNESWMAAIHHINFIVDVAMIALSFSSGVHFFNVFCFAITATLARVRSQLAAVNFPMPSRSQISSIV